MADPLTTLGPRFAAAIAAALGDEHASVDPMLRRSTVAAANADYQANFAMGLGKKLKRPPREVAQAVVEKLDLSGIADRVEVAGPGFVNIALAPTWLSSEVERAAADARLGVVPARAPETVVVDYSAPNVAKEMHVGHLRSTIIGDALARVLEHLGHRVIRQNHIGDWGTPFGKLIEHLVDVGEQQAVAELSVGDLNSFYQQANKKFEADPAFADRARKRVVALQAGDESTLALWRLLVAESKRYFTVVYTRLGVTLKDEDICAESFYNPMLPVVAADLEQKGLARISEGALCVFPAGFTGKNGEPQPLIVRKTDGGYGYGATDLAAVRHRTGTLGATRLLYVVGSPQKQHLAMVYAAAREAGWLLPPARAEHVAFGSVLGADKKMYKSRAGDSVRLVDLLAEAVERAAAVVAEKNPQLDEAARAEVARMVGIGAVKYADLSNARIGDYVFDWDRMLSFEGNTAPYLQYAHARIRSIFRRVEAAPVTTSAHVQIAERAEHALALELLSFGGVVDSVADTLEPHRLCTYLYALASAFTTFYEQCPVLKAATDEQRQSRLVLCDLTARVLAAGLDLLGIEAPQQM
jgi:arginyl-tRNA synthetase